jgi:hypothetical protein
MHYYLNLNICQFDKVRLDLFRLVRFGSLNIIGNFDQFSTKNRVGNGGGDRNPEHDCFCTWDRCYDFKNIFAEKFKTKILLLLVFAKIVIITLVFEKNTNFFAENWQKSQKIVIITSTPDEFVEKIAQSVAQNIFVKNHA